MTSDFPHVGQSTAAPANESSASRGLWQCGQANFMASVPGWRSIGPGWLGTGKLFRAIKSLSAFFQGGSGQACSEKMAERCARAHFASHRSEREIVQISLERWICVSKSVVRRRASGMFSPKPRDRADYSGNAMRWQARKRARPRGVPPRRAPLRERSGRLRAFVVFPLFSSLHSFVRQGNTRPDGRI